METEVKNDYIEKALNELIPSLGVKEFVNHKKIISLIKAKKIKEAIKTIALYLGLPIEVKLSYVPKGYRPGANDGFHSTHLVKTSFLNNSTSGIIAQVSIPSDLPLYGTAGMVDFPISVRLSENCAENPATLISILAHELSHILLHSIWHKEKENEFYTDLTAMILGFADIIKKGRKIVKTSTHTDHGFSSTKTTTTTHTTTFGYLSDENFNFAFNKIEAELKKQKSDKKKLLKEQTQFKKQLKKAKRLFLYFSSYLDYLDKNLNQKMPREDGYKISAYHQQGYNDKFQSVVKKCETNLDTSREFVGNITNYTGRNVEIIHQYADQLSSDSKELNNQFVLLKKDVDILKKYVGFFYKLKLKFKPTR